MVSKAVILFRYAEKSAREALSRPDSINPGVRFLEVERRDQDLRREGEMRARVGRQRDQDREQRQNR